MAAIACIALGSNLGRRTDNLDRALQVLRAHPAVTIVAVSSYHETAPVGGPPGQGPYLNAAATLTTTLSPEELLRLLLETEQGLGRVRQERFGPRTIDLDLLLYDDLVKHDEVLTVPHPRMHERFFVLEPLAEIAPDRVHPGLGHTVRELLETQRRAGGVSPLFVASPGGLRPPLAGLRAVVTGSTSGIGRAIALAFAAAGADVIIHGRRAGAAPEAVADQVRSRGVQAITFLADLREAEACQILAASAWDLWNGIDIWVNNAGADTLTGKAAEWSFDQKLAELLAVDVSATVLLARAVGVRMKQQGHGVILNMGWDQADTGMEGDSGQLFGTVKAAVMAFSKSLAVTLAPEVRVNCLAPGWIRTAWGEQASSHWQERVEREVPLRRWGRPEDVAATALWLVSPAAAYITGQVVRINGGAVR